MPEAIRFGVSMDPDLLEKFDTLLEQKGYSNRSEALRDLIREALVEDQWEAGQEVVGTITLVYDHHTRELTDQLTEIQHDHDAEVLSTLHVHLDRHHCLETVVVKGDAAVVQSIADKLIGIRGVLHGRLVATTSGLG